MEAAESPSPKDYPLYSLRKSSSSASFESVLFQKDCIFCNVLGHIRVIVAGSWIHQQTSKFEYGGGQKVITVATEKDDHLLLTRIQGRQDLFAREAHFHPACRKKYTADPTLWNSSNTDQIEAQVALEESHASALQKVITFINEKIIAENKVVTLSHLRQRIGTDKLFQSKLSG